MAKITKQISGRARTHPKAPVSVPSGRLGTRPMLPDLAEASTGRQGAQRGPVAGGRHMHLVLGPSCPPLQPLNWVGQGGVGTGGAGKGVPRSPAGVDPKETPFITKHLAGKLRTRHKQVSGKETGGQKMGSCHDGATFLLLVGEKPQSPLKSSSSHIPRLQRFSSFA